MSTTFFTNFRYFFGIVPGKSNFFPGMEAEETAYGILGDENGKKQREIHPVLDPDSGNGGYFSRSSQPRWHANLRTTGHQTSVVTAGMVVSGGVEHPLCFDGGGGRISFIPGGSGRSQPRAEFDGGTVGGEFFLATVVF